MTALDSIFTEFRAPDNTPLHGKSVTEVNAREVSEDHTAVTRYDLYRTTSADAAAEHVERHERLVEGGELTPVPLPEFSSGPTSVSADIPDAREALADRPRGGVGRAPTDDTGSAASDSGLETCRDVDL
ncbi:hypothetical protein R1X32_01965 (plasmid) [Rhodococcus opacus]|uniref:hypothetical protein n=1 Tax=Rhodococcus opacus TaxID=37919 RepID=UPI00146E99EB|nr:hypothetical protein HJ581_0047290 [Rhodococcus opacus]